MAAPKGHARYGGRQAGVPNKATAKCRETIALIADDMADQFKEWLLRTAEGDPEAQLKPDPKGAADLYLKAIEYHIPKLARTELANSGDKPFVVQVTSYTGEK